ncbi:MAG: hypothetical protein WDN75_09475 [Bacteroidota bacterium]
MEEEQYPATIESTLLLTSDLKGYIHNPGYYFKDTLPGTRYRADLLMMTHGWRRFTWRNLLNDSIPKFSYQPERGLSLSGKVGGKKSKKKDMHGTIKILTPEGDLVIAKANSDGKFYTDELIYYDSAELIIETDNARGIPQDLDLVLSPFTPPPRMETRPFMRNNEDVKAFLAVAQENRRVEEAIKIELGTTVLKDVIVKSTKIESESGVVDCPWHGSRPSGYLVTNSWTVIQMSLKRCGV